jgi:hypothetical protein
MGQSVSSNENIDTYIANNALAIKCPGPNNSTYIRYINISEFADISPVEGDDAYTIVLLSGEILPVSMEQKLYDVLVTHKKYVVNVL